MHADGRGGSLVLDIRVGPLGRIKRASGTTDPVQFTKVLDCIREHRRQRNWAPLAALANGDLHPLELLAQAEGRDLSRFVRIRHRAHLYVIRGKVTGRVKIGASSFPPRRFKELSVGSEEYELIAVVRDAGSKEQLIHQRFAAHRVWREWFEPAPEILAWIAELKTKRKSP